MSPTALCVGMPAVRHASLSYPLISLQRVLCSRVFASIMCNRVECLGDSCDTLFLMPTGCFSLAFCAAKGETSLFPDKAQDIELMVEILLPCCSPGCVQLFTIKDRQSLTLMARIPAQPVSPLWPVLDLRLSKSLLEKGELGGCARPCVCGISSSPPCHLDV